MRRLFVCEETGGCPIGDGREGKMRRMEERKKGGTERKGAIRTL